jgi:hypothetical protein
MNRLRRTLLVTSPLVSGFIIYFSCRPKSLLYYQWIPFKELIRLDHFHNYAAAECSRFFAGSSVANTIIFSIPAAMFAFSLAFYLKTRYLHKAFERLKETLENPGQPRENTRVIAVADWGHGQQAARFR